MKRNRIPLLLGFIGLATVALACWLLPLQAADSFTVPTQDLRATAPISQDLVVTNVNDTVGLKINKATASNANFVEFSHNGVLKWAVPTNGVLAVAYGGTAGATANAGFNSLSPVTTRGDLIYRNATVNARLAVGSANQVLTSNGTDPVWGQASLTAGVTGTLPIANGGTGGATAAAALTALGIQRWTATTAEDGTVTNTFATAYASGTPTVVITKVASASPTNSIATPTTTAVVITIGEPSIVVHGISIGVP